MYQGFAGGRGHGVAQFSQTGASTGENYIHPRTCLTECMALNGYSQTEQRKIRGGLHQAKGPDYIVTMQHGTCK